MRNEMRQTKPRTRPGESMVAVAVMLLVFFTIGVSILTAAAGTTAAASARVSQRQVYYDTRSLLVVLDGELRGGTLYSVICEDALDALEAAYAAGGADAEATLENRTIQLETTFSGGGRSDGNLRDELHFETPTLTYSGIASVLNTKQDSEGTSSISELAVRLNKVELKVRGVYRTDYTSSFTVEYRFSGFGKWNETANKWDWSGTWIVQQIS